MNHTPKHRLSTDELTSGVPASWLPFRRTTAELARREGIIGQDRALRAIETGLNIPTRGFNIFVAGEAGSGKTSTLERMLQERAAREPVPPDLCYVHNFHFPDRPRPIQLPRGKGRRFAKDMERVIRTLSRMVPRVLSDVAFGHVRAGILAHTHARAQTLTSRAARAARRLGLGIKEDDKGMQVFPLVNGEPVDTETFEQLSAEQRRRIEKRIVAFQEHLESYAYRRRQLELDHNSRQLAAEVRVVQPLVRGLLDDVAARYRRHSPVVEEFLRDVEEHVLENHRSFLPPEEQESEAEGEAEAGPAPDGHQLYRVNVVVDRTDDRGAPVVVEAVPSAANLCGVIEYRSGPGRLITDHMGLRAGALHQANGGYLLLQVSDLMSHENAWSSLKRALRHKKIRIEEETSVGDGRMRIAGAMKPDTVPLQVKVILVGPAEAYYMLRFHDEDFGRLFKIMAQFSLSMPRSRANVARLARFLGQVCREEGYLPLLRSGLTRLLEVACRRAAHKERMTTHRAELLDLLAEADYSARAAGARAIRDRDVQHALEEIARRHGAPADAVDRAILEGTILIRTHGTAVGQINGIALYDVAGTPFGVPTRITVRVYAGRRGVVNIDREVNLSGAIHDKGALILVGYLGGRFAQEQSLALSASITFEQSYDEIDGDSASIAELYALLSALAGCPIRQGIAVTGSVNQLGEVQPIGGVNEKIEGIFRVCSARGLTGEEGVLIPRSNVKNLMLGSEVVDAVRAGRFHVYAVSTIDEGIEVLTGLPAGRRRKDGSWTPQSINDRVQKRLRHLEGIVRSCAVELGDRAT
jgi:lon-related putative ATP-dependent protease